MSWPWLFSVSFSEGSNAPESGSHRLSGPKGSLREDVDWASSTLRVQDKDCERPPAGRRCHSDNSPELLL